MRTDYDEAVAAAIFYFVREYGGAPEIGLESFRARSSQALSKQGSHQNVLVFDIGGGTTDVALIQLRLTEEPVFAPGEDRGAGGRFYKITPKLLCSSGHLQLGGELITLHIFRLLKAVLADHVLTLTQDGKLRCDHFKALLTDVAATEFVDEKRRYKPGSIVKQFLKNETNLDVSNTSEALDLAERVLPTRWDRPAIDPDTAPVQAFYAALGPCRPRQDGPRRPGRGGRRPPAVRDRARAVPRACSTTASPASATSAPDPARNLCVRLTADQVEGAIGKTVMDAVKIAKGALTKLPDGEKLDWLILSGKSCHLAPGRRRAPENLSGEEYRPGQGQIRLEQRARDVRAPLCQARHLHWPCLAEYYRRYKAPPQESKHLLRRGMNMLHFAIDNLFSYLPCSFLLQTGDGDDTLFDALAELYEVEISPGDPRGKRRTDWKRRPLQLTVRREDYPNADLLRWVNFSTQALVNELGLQESTWEEAIKVQFEIDHRLNFDVLFCRFDKDEPSPHYRLTEQEPQLDLAAALARLAAGRGFARCAPVDPGAGARPFPAAFGRELGWTIGYTISDQETEPTILFKASTAFVDRLHPPEPDIGVKAGVVLPRATVEKFSANNRLKIYGQRASGR